MSTLVLQGADAALGSVVGAASSYLGRAVAGAVSGSGASDTVRQVDGPRLTEIHGLTSTEGAPIPRLFGRARLGGQVIWATRFEENANTVTDRQTGRGGKSLGSGRKTTTTVSTTYSYGANLAVGLCEGPIAFVRRVWADGREIDLTGLTMRVHPGDEEQGPDPLVVAKEGVGNAPAYRGLAYVVFEALPLAPFGNRVPQFSFEVVRPVSGLPEMIRSVCLIPGASEFGYELAPVRRDLGLGSSLPENVHQFRRTTDVAASLDQLQALCPNLRHVSLVVSWFGDDLRAGSCTVAPRVETTDKVTVGGSWSVAGLDRASAREVSRVDGLPAYGGTPSDASAVGLIRELKARGLAVTLYPFVMMDVPAGNGLPDPRTGAAGQPPYPWRGRITCDPAPGRPGSVDGTGAAADQVAAFFGGAGAGDWSFRRLIHHCAALAAEAGGVDGFVIGSELIGLTRIRSAPGTYPAVAALRALAGEVRAILGAGTKLTYAADWTEYGAHVLDGGAELRFPLDPLWADPDIDAVGIDFYPPVSDWRDGPVNADAAIARSQYDVAHLRGRVGSGEAFDWYYADEAGRAGQDRLPIEDGAYGRPWVFRPKDLPGWWSNPHRERVAGVETGATAWMPGAKPIWLTELGVPAVDKGANGPNVFPDPKSAESAAPPFSTGARDDLAQARAVEAILSRFDPALGGYQDPHNPVSATTGQRMVDPARMSVWAWDARPFPAFPDFGTVWADGANWQAGHWITGRLEGVPLDRLVRAVLADFGLEAGPDVPLDGFVDGYVVDRPMSAREALEPLAELFGFDLVASGDGFRWTGRGGRVVATLAPDNLVTADRGPVLSRTRAQETELSASLRLGFTDGEGEYRRAGVESRRLSGTSRREISRDAAIVSRRAEAQRLADIRLQDEWAGRELVEFALSPRAVALEPGDVVQLGDEADLLRIVRVADGPARRVSARSVEPATFTAPVSASSQPRRPPTQPRVAGPPAAVLLDLPASATDPAALQHVAVAAEPWPGAVAVWRSLDGGDFALHRVLELPSIIGRTLNACPAGPVWAFDRGTRLEVELSAASLSSVSDGALLAGANLFGLKGPDGAWEVLAAAHAELIGQRRYRLSRVLRGLGGTERLASRTVPAGAAIVRLDETVVPIGQAPADLGRTCQYRIGPADRDHADPSFVALAGTVGNLALRPLAPVRPAARRTPDGIALAWIRRTRTGGDSWDVVEVPLGEEAERYEIDILDGAGTAVRTLSSSEQAVLYGAADELADFGTPQSVMTLRVAQHSSAVGRGLPLQRTIPIL